MRLWLIEMVESIRIAVEQVRVHKMRSMLTALGVIIGIVAVTLMGTAIKGIDVGFSKSLDMIGTDLFYVEVWPWGDPGENWRRYRNRPMFKASYADRVNELINQTPGSYLSMAVPITNTWRNVHYKEKMIRGVQVFGTNADYALLTTKDLAEGRYFTEVEALGGALLVVLGKDVADALFPEGNAVGREVTISNRRFQVLGVYERQGSFLGLFSVDKQVVMPLATVRKFYRGNWGNSIIIKMAESADKRLAEEEIEGHIRLIRKLMPGDTNNFEINKTESISEQLDPIKQGVAVAGLGITGLALFVGAIGIMNITFVSVRERTKEIGTRRALGARRRAILVQFLVEAISICVLGGLVGLIVTFGLFTAVSQAFPAFPMVFSPDLVLLALGVSVATGIFSGFVPAFMASQLDPAVALRHE